MKRLAVAVIAASILLSGCATPGQAGAPGVASEFDGHVVTNAEIDAIYQAWLHDFEGNDSSNRRQVATIALLTPALVAAANEHDLGLSEAQADQLARMWLGFYGLEKDPSPELRQAVSGIVALTYLAYGVRDIQALAEIAQRAEEEAEVSPRTGIFTAATFMDSVERAHRAVDAQLLGPYAFMEFQHVNGFIDANTAWAAGEN